MNPDRIASSKNVFPAGLRVFYRPVSSAEVPLRFVRALIVLVLIQFAARVTPAAGASAGLPTVAALELRHLEETYGCWMSLPPGSGPDVRITARCPSSSVLKTACECSSAIPIPLPVSKLQPD